MAVTHAIVRCELREGKPPENIEMEKEEGWRSSTDELPRWLTANTRQPTNEHREEWGIGNVGEWRMKWRRYFGGEGDGNGKEKEGGSVWHKEILGVRAIYPIVLPSILLLFQISTLKQIIYIKKMFPTQLIFFSHQ